MRPWIQDSLTFVLDLLYPRYCIRCNTEGSFLCISCSKKLALVKIQHCIICGFQSSLGITHLPCLKQRCAPNQLYAGFSYQDETMTSAMALAKEQFLPDIFFALGILLGKQLSPMMNDTEETIICPIPIPAKQHRQMGFNPAQIISQAVNMHTAWPIVPFLKGVRQINEARKKSNPKLWPHTKYHFSLSATNMLSPRSTILLINDIVTTGETFLEATRTIREYYENRIVCTAIAHG